MLFPVMAFARDNMAQEILGHAVNYDHVVIDGSPRGETLSRAVIIASDLIVIPRLSEVHGKISYGLRLPARPIGLATPQFSRSRRRDNIKKH